MFTELLCSVISSALNTPTNNEYDGIGLDSDWDYMLMPDPIAGDTNNIDSMYSCD